MLRPPLASLSGYLALVIFPWLLWSACLAVELLAAVLALLLARRDPQHRPVAALLVFAVVLDVALRASQALILDGAPRESVLPAYHLNMLGVTAWPVAVAMLAWWAFMGPQKAEGPDRSEPSSRGGVPLPLTSHEGVGGAEIADVSGRRAGVPTSPSRGPRSVEPQGVTGSLAVKALPALWLAANAYGLTLPPHGCPERSRWLHAIEIGAVVLGAVAVILGRQRRRERPAAVAFALVVVQGAIATVGPYVAGAPWEPGGWDPARVIYVIAFAYLCGVQAWWLRRRGDDEPNGPS